MKARKLTILLWSALVSQSFAQRDLSEQPTNEANAVVRKAAPSNVVMMLPNRNSSTRRASHVVDNRTTQGSGVEPIGIQDQSMGFEPDAASFLSTKPTSKVLVNPDQFWTRKSRPIIDQRGEGLFGDSCSACDEWNGFCGCCGLKASPGHLGQKWLGDNLPCECVEDCCPPKMERGCKDGHCKACRTSR